MKKASLLLISLMLAFCLCACGSPAPETLPDAAVTAQPTPSATPEPTPEPTPTVINLTLAGDIVMHTPLNAECLMPDGSYDYTELFEDVEKYISAGDYSVCCLETAFTGDGNWTGYPLFHSPDDLAYSLKDVGFDLINTASNHAVDGFQPGIIRTLDVLDEAGLDHVGTYRTQEESDENSGILVKDINGVTIAFLDYTYGTNAIPVFDYPYAVNVYYLDYMDYFNHIDYDMVDADMAAARALGTDLIAVSVHWGIQYEMRSVTAQEEFADYLFANGADLVIGGHPHVPEPMELREVTDEDGNTRTGFLCYCLGNLLSCQNQFGTDLTAVASVEITKDNVTGETAITSAQYVPLVMVDLSDYGISAKDWCYRLWDLRQAIADYEAGNDRGVMTQYMYDQFVKKLDKAREVLGPLEAPEA